MHRPKSNSRKVALQLDLYKALEGPNIRKEHFVDELLTAAKNLHYITTRTLTSELTKEQAKHGADILSGSLHTLCQLIKQIAKTTAKHRKTPDSYYDKLAEMPDNLSYFDPASPDMLAEYAVKSSVKINGLFIAYKDLLPPDAPKLEILRGLYQAESYFKYLM